MFRSNNILTVKEQNRVEWKKKKRHFFGFEKMRWFWTRVEKSSKHHGQIIDHVFVWFWTKHCSFHLLAYCLHCDCLASAFRERRPPPHCVRLKWLASCKIALLLVLLPGNTHPQRIELLNEHGSVVPKLSANAQN